MNDYVLYVGQMFPRRHAKETILACKKLGLELVLVGVDKYTPRLMGDQIHFGAGESISWYDRVTEDKLQWLYKNARLFVYVSDTEAFGLPPLEALAHGVRPVVADTDVSHELLGDDAIYCEPTVDGIAEAIQKGLAMPKPQPINNFSWKDHTDRFIELCRNLVA